MAIKKKVVLTFDDGHKYTKEILEKLRRHHVKATFFMCGWCIERSPEVYCSIFKEGHDIGNHSYSHAYMDKLSDEEVIDEIEKVQKISARLIGKESAWFRFPYGKKDERLCHLVKEKGLHSVGWSIDSRDWEGISTEQIVKNVMGERNIRSGDIILMHTSGEHTAEALDVILPALKEQGIQIIKMSEVFRHPMMYVAMKKRKLII